MLFGSVVNEIIRNSGSIGVYVLSDERGPLRQGLPETWRPRSGTTAGSCASTWCHGAVINRNGGTSGGMRRITMPTAKPKAKPVPKALPAAKARPANAPAATNQRRRAVKAPQRWNAEARKEIGRAHV